MAVGNCRSADAATEGAESGLAFGINDKSPFLTLASAVVTLASSVHSTVTEPISELPRVTTSSSIFCVSAEKSVVSPSTGAVLMAVEAEG
jgi:hypothetical protein